ncbi:MAG: hypothetical protein AABX17_00480 [Nanoarchaeota archaeon]
MVKKENKLKPFLITGIILILFVILLIFLRSPEDYWILDERGVWIMHGNVSDANTPEYVTNQQIALDCAGDLRDLQAIRGIGSNSECLGSCYDYAVDIVHIPRTAEDNFVENQCKSYINGTLQHFIEIDKDGNIVRVV